MTPEPPAYRRRAMREVESRLTAPSGVVEVLRGPRQVGKTTGLYQIIQDLTLRGVPGRDILFVRFDLDILRESPQGLMGMVRWYASDILKRPLASSDRPYIFLDEVHKLRDWDAQVKHLVDTFAVRVALTGSSSVRVARGGRESLAGRIYATELPPFSFREVVEAWPVDASPLPESMRFRDAFQSDLPQRIRGLHEMPPAVSGVFKRQLERYFNRGGYPRLYSGEIPDELWADYLVQTVFENVLGADIPDLYPVQDPRLLRHLYLAVARLTGSEIAQAKLVDDAKAAGFATSQPTVGRYLRYLADALLTREFRRYPLLKKHSARVPSKITVADLGVRNAIFRGAPSLYESDPTLLGPLVETLVQSVIRDANLQVHFWRDYAEPGNRKSAMLEVDFVAERIDGVTLPIEVKFRRRIDAEDSKGMRAYLSRYTAPHGIIVTRDQFEWDEDSRILYVPLLDFLLAF